MDILDNTTPLNSLYAEVDASFADRLVAEDAPSSTQTDNIHLELVSDFAAARADWLMLEREAAQTPFQTFAWTQAWFEHVSHAENVQPTILIGRDSNNIAQFILPFCLRKHGPVIVLEWLAGAHANYTGGLFRSRFLTTLDKPKATKLWAKIEDFLPHYDIAQFMSQLPELMTATNPMAYLAHRESASPCYIITLENDWEAFHLKRRSKSGRSSERKRQRRLEKIGPILFEVHESGKDLEHVMETLITQKRSRFDEQGIADFFSDPHFRDFYRALIRMTAKADGIGASISTLKVDGEIIATILNVTHDNKNYALISSITSNEELRKCSPGEMIMRLNIKHCCEAGMHTYDCGGGTCMYKESWSDIKFNTYHTIAAHTFLGHAYAGSYGGFLSAKARIKNSPILWQAFKTLRKLGFSS